MEREDKQTKYELLWRAMLETDVDAVKSIVERLKREEITKEDAEILLGAKHWLIRNYALVHVSKNEMLGLAITTEDLDEVEIIIERLEKEGIIEEEADVLLGAKYCRIRKFTVRFASKEKVLEAAIIEMDPDVVEIITERLEKEGITKEEADVLLGAKHRGIREFAVKYATMKEALDLAVIEKI